MIEIKEDEPCKFALNLALKYTVRKHYVPSGEPNKTTWRMFGNVFNLRVLKIRGKMATIRTRLELKVDNKDFTPPMFTVKNVDGKEIIKETIGKPFC